MLLNIIYIKQVIIGHKKFIKNFCMDIEELKDQLLKYFLSFLFSKKNHFDADIIFMP